MHQPMMNMIMEIASIKFYDTLTMEIKRIRDTYGEQIVIVIMGDFNARVGNDGGDLFTYEWTIPGNNAVKGRYGFSEINENGNNLILFCEMQDFKIMDTFFPRINNDYGTWKSNRSLRPEYTAALDHILVNAPLWEGVKQCGVTDDIFQMPTDHRIVELEINDRWNTTRGNNKKEGRQKRSSSS